MAYDDVLTRNDNEELAVRVVSATESATVVNPNDVYTRDTSGNLAIRTVGNSGGGGGSDPHNLGWYATPEALRTAHPTADDGDWAIVGSTDTVWVWDSDTNAWKDTDQKGQVTSVNGQTGDVTVQATLVNQSNIKSVNGNSLLGSGNLELSTYLPYPAGWTTTGTTKVFCDDIAADTTAIGGKAYLGEVTFSDLPASMTNAEIVVEIMAGTTAQNKVIVLTCTSGNTAPYMWKYTYWNNGTDVSGWKGFQEQLVSGTNIKTINSNSILGSGNLDIDGLPSQTGNAGKFLITDGTDAGWSNSADNFTAISTSIDSKVEYKSYASVFYPNKNQAECCEWFYEAGSINGESFFTLLASNRNSSRKHYLGKHNYTFDRIYVAKIANGSGADINVPTTGGTLALTSDLPSSPATMPTLAVADWSNNTQTVTVTGVTASNIVFVSPAPASASDYASAGIICTAQGTDSLTFTCTTVPSNAITVNVVIMG